MEKDWIEVFVTSHEYKASMAKDMLDNAGIICVIMNQHDSAYKSFGDFSVMVAHKDKPKAVEILKNLKH